MGANDLYGACESKTICLQMASKSPAGAYWWFSLLHSIALYQMKGFMSTGTYDLPNLCLGCPSSVFQQRLHHNPGGKLGQRIKADFNIQYAGELAGISRQALCRKYGDKTGAWLHLAARGEASEPVKDRLIPKSLG